METSCQASYPLNSQNASPPGTLRLYLSCCAKAKLPKTASNAATITVAGNRVLFMAHSYAAVGKSNSVARGPSGRRTVAIVALRIGTIHGTPALPALDHAAKQMLDGRFLVASRGLRQPCLGFR